MHKRVIRSSRDLFFPFPSFSLFPLRLLFPFPSPLFFLSFQRGLFAGLHQTAPLARGNWSNDAFKTLFSCRGQISTAFHARLLAVIVNQRTRRSFRATLETTLPNWRTACTRYQPGMESASDRDDFFRYVNTTTVTRRSPLRFEGCFFFFVS